MSTEEKQDTEELKSTEERRNAEPETDEHHQVVDEPEERPATEKPEITDEHKEKAKEMRKDYEVERPTITMPGTDGAVSGTAINDWIDDDGNPKFSEESKKGDERTKGDESEKDDAGPT